MTTRGTSDHCLRGVRIIHLALYGYCSHWRTPSPCAEPCFRIKIHALSGSRTVTRFIRHSTSRRPALNDHFRCYNALSSATAPRLCVMTLTLQPCSEHVTAPCVTTAPGKHYNVISTSTNSFLETYYFNNSIQRGQQTAAGYSSTPSKSPCTAKL